MKVLKIEVNDEQYEVIQKKLGANVDMCLRIAIEDHVNRITRPEPLPAIDLSGRAKSFRSSINKIDINEPEKPIRGSKETDEAWKKRFAGYLWQVGRHKEKLLEADRRRKGGRYIPTPV